MSCPVQVFSCPVLSFPFLPCNVLSCPVFCVLLCSVLSYEPILSHLVLSCSVMLCLNRQHPVLSCPAMLCSVLSCHNSPCSCPVMSKCCVLNLIVSKVLFCPLLIYNITYCPSPSYPTCVFLNMSFPIQLSPVLSCPVLS